MTVSQHTVGLWNCLQASDGAGGHRGVEGFQERDPAGASGDTESGAKELGLVAMPPSYHGQKALFPGPLGRGAPEILRSHCGQTKNRARRSWLVREGCGDTTWLGQSCRP